MNIRIRLYAKTDPDLIVLDSAAGFPLGKWMKAAVQAYARGEDLIIPVPKIPDTPVNIQERGIYFTLSEKTDDDAIKMMKAFRPRFRNTAVKLLFRAYLERPFITPFFSEYAESLPVGKKPGRGTAKRGEKPKAEKKGIPSGKGKALFPEHASHRPDPPSSVSSENVEKNPPDQRLPLAESDTCDNAFDLFGTIGGMMP